MQQTLLEQILVYENKTGSRRTIDQYLTKTIALFTPEPPEVFIPVSGPWAPSISAQIESFHAKQVEMSSPIPEPFTPPKWDPPDPMGLSFGKGTTKFMGPEIDTPLMRIDRHAHDGLPDNHLQFGRGDYTGRHGNEAYDIYAQVFKETKRPIEFPFDEKKDSKAMGVLVMKIKIYDINENLVYEGVYEYLEWISREKGQISFYVASHSPDLKKSLDIQFHCDSKEEIDSIINELNKINKK